jgi:hypothetical protein
MSELKLIPYGENRWIVEGKSDDPILGREPIAVFILTAEKDARLFAAAPELLGALKDVFSLLDSGYLVRNTDDDGKPGFALRQIDPITKLAAAARAITKAQGTESHENTPAKKT